jgi:hypothetical protein
MLLEKEYSLFVHEHTGTGTYRISSSSTGTGTCVPLDTLQFTTSIDVAIPLRYILPST